MFLVGLITWWYGDGWKKRVLIATERLSRLSDYFSITLLLGTLFAPFRQISSGGMQGNVAAQLRGFFDTLLSRVIGLVVRSFMILFGLLAIIFVSIWNAIVIVFWAVLPVMPVIAMIIFAIGWVPSWQ